MYPFVFASFGAAGACVPAACVSISVGPWRHPDIFELSPCRIDAHWKRTWSFHDLEPLIEHVSRKGLHLPIVIGKGLKVHTGSRRFHAARFAGLKKVPCVHRNRLSVEERAAFRFALFYEQEGCFEIPLALRTFDIQGLAGSPRPLTFCRQPWH
jgi:hypothetical protein